MGDSPVPHFSRNLCGWHLCENTAWINLGAYDLQSLSRNKLCLRDVSFRFQKFKTGKLLGQLESNSRCQSFDPHPFTDRVKVIDSPGAYNGGRTIADETCFLP